MPQGWKPGDPLPTFKPVAKARFARGMIRSPRLLAPEARAHASCSHATVCPPPPMTQPPVAAPRVSLELNPDLMEPEVEFEVVEAEDGARARWGRGIKFRLRCRFGMLRGPRRELGSTLLRPDDCLCRSLFSAFFLRRGGGGIGLGLLSSRRLARPGGAAGGWRGGRGAACMNRGTGRGFLRCRLCRRGLGVATACEIGRAHV